MNPEHPHRLLLVELLRLLPWLSLIEVGCGAGANLKAILKVMPNRQVGGIDVNKDAIEFCKKEFTRGLFKVGKADDIMLSDKSCDILLADMLYIYISPRKIERHLRELKRVARNHIVLFELNSPSLWERLALKWKEGYNAYNWKKLLKENEFYDIETYKIPREAWPESDLQQKYGTIIVCKVPRDYQ